MANKARGYGLSAELAKKKAEKWNADLADEAMTWIKDMLAGTSEAADKILADINFPITKPEDVHKPLKNGRLLCMLINRVKPGQIKTIGKGTGKFQEMENISNFLLGCEALGCVKNDLFQSVELHEADDIAKVVDCIYALGRKANKILTDGPKLGPDEASENKREFTEEQMAAGQNVIGLQMGSNKGASQAGQNFGKTRAIMD